MSDLHLERQPDWQPEAAPGCDILVLAGDIGSYQPGSRLGSDDFGLARFSPRQPGARWRTVLYVPGNHEYDHRELHATQAELRRLCESLGITWLHERVVVIDGVRFVGSTLWSSYDSYALSFDAGPKREAAMQKSFRAANFYLHKNTTRIDGVPVLAEQQRPISLDCQAWLRAALAEPFDGPTVAVTHFAPSLRSVDPRYGLMPSTAGFCNALDDLLPQADVWLHGHLHCPIDYLARGQHADGTAWVCHVVANPLGYAHKGEQAGYRPQAVVTVPRAPGLAR